MWFLRGILKPLSAEPFKTHAPPMWPEARSYLLVTQVPDIFFKSNWSNIGLSRILTSRNHKRPSTTCAPPPQRFKHSACFETSFHTQKHCFGTKNTILIPPPPLATQKTREWSLFSYPHFIQEAASDKGASFIYTSLGSQGKDISFVYLCCINFSK